MSVTLQVYEGKPGMRPKTAPDHIARKELEEPEVRRRDTEAEARAYLDRHRLHEFMHALFELLLRERPADPYSFIAARFRDAALLELKNPPSDVAAISNGEKVPRSLVSTAPTSSPAAIREVPSTSAPEGTFQVTVRTLRGRSVARLTAQPGELVSSLKARLEASLGIPAASQQLYWWAETLPNDTCLEDHGVTPGLVSLHLSCSTRDPRLRLAVTGSCEGGLRMWSLENGELVRDFGGGGPSAALAVSVHWESMRALTGSVDGRLRLWDLNVGCLRAFDAHSEEVSTLEVDWPSMRALSGSTDGTAKLWNLEDGVCLQTLSAGSTVFSLAANWTEMKAFGGLRSGRVRLWDLSSGEQLAEFGACAATAEQTGTTISAVAIDTAGLRAVSGFADGHLGYWHLGRPEGSPEGEAEQPTRVLLAHYSAVRAITAHWRETDSRALCGSDDGSLSLWRLDPHECLARFARHIGFVWTICADWGRDRALSGAFDGCFKLWDLRTGECLRTLQSHSRPVRSIAAG